MMEKEKISLLQRFIIWRENKIKEKQFILILSFLVGIFTAIAALLLKFFIHTIQNFLTDNFNTTEANYLYLVYPVVGIFLAGWFVHCQCHYHRFRRIGRSRGTYCVDRIGNRVEFGKYVQDGAPYTDVAGRLWSGGCHRRYF